MDDLEFLLDEGNKLLNFVAAQTTTEEKEGAYVAAALKLELLKVRALVAIARAVRGTPPPQVLAVPQGTVIGVAGGILASSGGGSAPYSGIVG